MTGYTRQSAASIVPGADIDAQPLNNEFNRLQSAFSSSGHTHDGLAGNGPKLDINDSTTGILGQDRGGLGLKSNFSATTSPTSGDDTNDGYSKGSLWFNTTAGSWFICVDNSSGAAVWERIIVENNNVISANANNTIDIGSSSVKFKDLYLAGTSYVNTLDATTVDTDTVTATNVNTTDLNVSGTASVDILAVDAAALNSLSMLGDLDMDSNKITNVGTPTVTTDAVNKTYVDSYSGSRTTLPSATTGTDTLQVNRGGTDYKRTVANFITDNGLNKNVANGVAGLDASSDIKSNHLPLSDGDNLLPNGNLNQTGVMSSLYTATAGFTESTTDPYQGNNTILVGQSSVSAAFFSTDYIPVIGGETYTGELAIKAATATTSANGIFYRLYVYDKDKNALSPAFVDFISNGPSTASYVLSYNRVTLPANAAYGRIYFFNTQNASGVRIGKMGLYRANLHQKISDASLSIAKTSGLQTALDSKLSTTNLYSSIADLNKLKINYNSGLSYVSDYSTEWVGDAIGFAPGYKLQVFPVLSSDPDFNGGHLVTAYLSGETKLGAGIQESTLQINTKVRKGYATPWAASTAYSVGDQITYARAIGNAAYTCTVAGTSAATGLGPITPFWEPGKAYEIFDNAVYIADNAKYRVIVAGTSSTAPGATGPISGGTGTSIADGSVVWQYVGPAGYPDINRGNKNQVAITDGTVTWVYSGPNALSAKVGLYNELNAGEGAGSVWAQTNNLNVVNGDPENNGPTWFVTYEGDLSNNTNRDYVPNGSFSSNNIFLVTGGKSKNGSSLAISTHNTADLGYGSHWGIRIAGEWSVEETAIEVATKSKVGLGFNTYTLGYVNFSEAAIKDVSTGARSIWITGSKTTGAIVEGSSSPFSYESSGTKSSYELGLLANAPKAINITGTKAVGIDMTGATIVGNQIVGTGFTIGTSGIITGSAVNAGFYLSLTATLVANLGSPAANTGRIKIVTDAANPTDKHGTVTGGGSGSTLVRSDGTVWRIM